MLKISDRKIICAIYCNIISLNLKFLHAGLERWLNAYMQLLLLQRIGLGSQYPGEVAPCTISSTEK